MTLFLNNVNLNKNELQNARVQNLTSDPGTPVEGQIYWHSTNKRLMIYNGTSFLSVTDISFLPVGSGSTQVASGSHTHSGLVTNGDTHDHNGGDGAQIAYANLSGTPTLGTAAALNAGSASNNLVQVGNALTASQVLLTDATGKMSSSATNSGFNRALGTGATDVASGSHTHTGLVTNGDTHDHNGGDGAQIAYSGLSGLPSLGSAAALNAGSASNNLLQIGNAITASQNLMVDSAGKMSSSATNSAFNKAFGTTAGTIVEIGNTITASQVALYDSAGKLSSSAKGTGFNLDTGTSAGTVAVGNHNHTGVYAPSGEGVTNGNSHDHNGGDGAQIAYANLSGLPSLGSAAALNTGSVNGTIPLIGAGDKLPVSILPATVISEAFAVADQTAMLALSTAYQGDLAIRADVNKTYILNSTYSNAYATVSNWLELKTPTDAVTSVNTYTGAVTLNKTDIGLGNVDNQSRATLLSNSTLTGDAAVPNQLTSDSSSKPANTKFVLDVVGAIGSGAKRYSQNIGDGAAATIYVTHSLATTDVMWSCRYTDSNGAYVYPDAEVSTSNVITFKFAAAPTTSQFRVTILG